MNYYLQVFKKYAIFKGRANRAEYWYFVLFNFIASGILVAIDLAVMPSFGSYGVLITIYSLFVLIPSLAVAIRRLHDTGRSGWFVLLDFIPVIGQIWLIILLATKSKPGANKYGPGPMGSATETPIV